MSNKIILKARSLLHLAKIFLLILVLFYGCNKDFGGYYDTPEGLAGPIYKQLMNDPDFSEFTKAIDKIPVLKNKKAFLFYTSGQDKSDSDRELREKLLAKGFDIIGAFSCPGWDTWGPLKLFGGIYQGRPSEEDLEKARNFARYLLKKLKP